MRLKLKQITLTNFKGVKSKTFKFEDGETWIHGRNGSGKTSLFDSFVWCMFGKDHFGRADYELKTHDKDGNTIPRLDCEVEAIIEVDGVQTVLKRVYTEEWVKPRTQEEEVFKGNKTNYYLNDILVKKSEYDDFVLNLCSEQVFKSITNPAYFPNLSKDEQRKILFSIAGELTDEQVAGENKEFQALLAEITGISFENFKKDINAKKRRVKEELEGIPYRIDELKRSIPEMPNEEEISKEIDTAQGRINEIDKSLNDSAENMSTANQDRMKIQSDINKFELDNQQIGHEFTKNRNDEIAKKRNEIQELENSTAGVAKKEADRLAKISTLNSEKELNEKRLNELREEWRTINAQQLVFPDGAFQCPTCNRLLEVGDIERKQSEMTENFNQEKAKKIAENKEKGLSVSKRINEIVEELKALEEPVKPEMFVGTRIDVLKDALNKILSSDPEAYKQSKTYIANLAEIEKLKLKLSSVPVLTDNTELINEKRNLVSKVDSLKSKLALKDVVTNTNTRIEQLEKQKKTLNQELANLEKKEFLLKEFEYSKNAEYESRINGLFEFTKFRLFRTQVDGQIVPDCECMVDGVPYSTLNNAMQVGAGLDIIRTISNVNDKYAPIVIDNRESITDIPKVGTQVINLVVDPSKDDLEIVEH